MLVCTTPCVITRTDAHIIWYLRRAHNILYLRRVSAGNRGWWEMSGEKQKKKTSSLYSVPVRWITGCVRRRCTYIIYYIYVWATLENWKKNSRFNGQRRDDIYLYFIIFSYYRNYGIIGPPDVDDFWIFFWNIVDDVSLWLKMYSNNMIRYILWL